MRYRLFLAIILSICALQVLSQKKNINSYYSERESLYTNYLQREANCVQNKENPYTQNTFYFSDQVDFSKVQKGQIVSKIEGIENWENPQLFYKNLEKYDIKNKNQYYNSSFAFLDTYILPMTLNESVTYDEARFVNKKMMGRYLIKSLTQQDDIKLIDDLGIDIQREIQSVYRNQIESQKYQYGPYLVQKYISNPLLIKKRKFDWNCLVGIISTDPLIVIFNNGYTVKTYKDFKQTSKSPKVHFVNHESQKKSKNWKKEYNFENTYDFKLLKFKIQKYNSNVTEFQIVEAEEKIKAAITYALLSVKEKIIVKRGQTQLLSVTFQLDENLNPFFIGVKNQPFLKDQTDIQTQVFSDFVRDYLDAVLALNNLTKEQIIKKQIENQQFICNYVKRGFCKVLINEAGKTDYIQENINFIQSWKVPYVNQVQQSQLINNNGDKLNKIKKYYLERIKKTKSYSLTDYLKLLKIQRTRIPTTKFQQDLIFKLDDPQEYKLLAGQMVLFNLPFEKYLTDNLIYNQILQDYKLSVNNFYQNQYDFSFVSLRQYQMEFQNFQDGLTESEQKFLENEKGGIWKIKQDQQLYQKNQKQDIFDFQVIKKALLDKKYSRQQFENQNEFYNNKLIIQQYIENPLYLNGEQFRYKQNVIIFSTDPFIALCYPGIFNDSYKENIQQFQLMEMKAKIGVNYAILAFKEKISPRKEDSFIFDVESIVDDQYNPFIISFNGSPFVDSIKTKLNKETYTILKEWFDISAALYTIENKEIIFRSKQDPFFFCEIARDQQLCRQNTLVNEAADYNFLDTIDLSQVQKKEYKNHEKKYEQQNQEQNQESYNKEFILIDRDISIEL